MPHKTYETKLSPVLGILSRFVKKKINKLSFPRTFALIINSVREKDDGEFYCNFIQQQKNGKSNDLIAINQT